MGEIFKNTVTKTTTPQVSEYKRRVDERYVFQNDCHDPSPHIVTD